MQDLITITDTRCADIRFQDGALPHAMGVKSYQVLRANRAHPDQADGFGWTYNHAPMLCHCHGRFYLEYLSDPVSEHEAPGHTLLTTSEDGAHWSMPRVLFPTLQAQTAPYRGPCAPIAEETLQTVPHQRMGFFEASNGVLLALSFYGLVPDWHRSAPCDGWGIGRAVRRIFPDASFGDICYLLYNTPAGYSEENAPQYAHFCRSDDAAFVSACEELLNHKAAIWQMYEEQRFDSTLFPMQSEQALCTYTVSEHEMIGVYKKGLATVSRDGGRTWEAIRPNPTLQTATGKVWGQRTSDGRFCLCYNPTTDGQHRWPIAVVTGEDGHSFGQMLAVTGPMSPQRYGGLDKNLGPQYMRGICEYNGQTPDGDVWLAYSNNKEDLWVSRIPVPITGHETKHVDETFSECEALPNAWSLYSPAWSPVFMARDGLTLEDQDPYDRAAAERAICPAEQGCIALEFCVECIGEKGAFCVELQDDQGSVPVRVLFADSGWVFVRSGGRAEPMWRYEMGKTYVLSVEYDCVHCSFSVRMGSDAGQYAFSASVRQITRLFVATKETKHIPYNTVDSNGKYGTRAQVLPGCEEKTTLTKARIVSLNA